MTRLSEEQEKRRRLSKGLSRSMILNILIIDFLNEYAKGWDDDKGEKK